MNRYNIPAGFEYSFGVRLSRADADSNVYHDIRDASAVPGSDWTLCFVNSRNESALDVPLDWSQMNEDGLILVTLTPQQTLGLAGRRLHLEVRNNLGVSDLMDCPDSMFYFVPNDLHK